MSLSEGNDGGRSGDKVCDSSRAPSVGEFLTWHKISVVAERQTETKKGRDGNQLDGGHAVEALAPGQRLDGGATTQMTTVWVARSLVNMEALRRGKQGYSLFEKARSHLLHWKVNTDPEENLETESYLFDDHKLL